MKVTLYIDLPKKGPYGQIAAFQNPGARYSFAKRVKFDVELPDPEPMDADAEAQETKAEPCNP